MQVRIWKNSSSDERDTFDVYVSVDKHCIVMNNREFMSFASTIITGWLRVKDEVRCRERFEQEGVLAKETVYGRNVLIGRKEGKVRVTIETFHLCFGLSEYSYFAEEVMKYAECLFQERGLNWNLVDLFSLDWGWLYNYTDIIELKKTTVNTGYLKGDLYFLGDERLKSICRIGRSRYVHAFKYYDGKEGFTPNKYINKNDGERLAFSLKNIKEKGYPYNQGYIMIDNIGDIWDGYHRAASLFYLYGGQYKIEVLQLSLRNATSFRQRKWRDLRKAAKKIIRGCFPCKDGKMVNK